MIEQEFINELIAQGYYQICEKPQIGICALRRFAFTTGLVVGIDIKEILFIGGYNYRYCYQNHIDAVEDIKNWDGVGDPKGNWIKKKGSGYDVTNPKHIDVVTVGMGATSQIEHLLAIYNTPKNIPLIINDKNSDNQIKNIISNNTKDLSEYINKSDISHSPTYLNRKARRQNNNKKK